MPYKDPKKKAAAYKAWREKNQDVLRIKNKEAMQRWRVDNRERSREINRESMQRWREEHREEYNQRMREYRAAHPEKISAMNKKRYANKKYAEITKQAAKAAYAADPERRKKVIVAWRKNNRDKVNQIQQNRIARLKGAVGFHTAKEWWQLLAVTGYRCAYCRRHLTDKTATRDHIVPLSKGGSNDIGNIIPSCQLCNSKKGSSLPV